MLANDLSEGEGKAFEQAILDYSRIVVSAEWEALSNRQPSVDAQNAFQKVVVAAGRLNLTRSTDSAIQSQLLSLISQAHAFRETRLFQANQGLPITNWVVLSFYSLLPRGMEGWIFGVLDPSGANCIKAVCLTPDNEHSRP
jgi:hypothetical protein